MTLAPSLAKVPCSHCVAFFIQQRPLAFFHCSSGSADLTEHQRLMFPYLHPCSYVRRMSLLVPDRPGRAWGFPVVIPSSVTNPCCNLQKPQGAAPPVCGTRNAAAACSLMGPNHDRAQATTPCLPPSNRRRRTSERTTKRRQRRPFPSQGGEKPPRGGREARRSLQHVTHRVFFLFGGGFLANSADAYYNGMRKMLLLARPKLRQAKARQGKLSEMTRDDEVPTCWSLCRLLPCFRPSFLRDRVCCCWRWPPPPWGTLACRAPLLPGISTSPLAYLDEPHGAGGQRRGGGSGWWWAYSTHDGTSMGQEKGPPPTFAPAPRLCIKRRDGSAASTRPTNTSPSDYQARLILRHAWGMGLGSAKTANRRPWRSGQTAKVTNYLN